MTIYTYPDDIVDPQYEHRKVTLFVKKVAVNDTVAKAEAFVAAKIRDASRTATRVASTVFDMELNIQANVKSHADPTVDTIVLPIPNEFEDSQSHTWGEQTGIIGTAGASLMRSTLSNHPQTPSPEEDAAQSRIKRASKKVARGVLGALSSITADQALGSITTGLGMRKPLFDPGYFLNYSGSSLRTFSAKWDLVPNSPKEAQSIIAIIMKLKQLSSPQQTIEGVSLLAPYYFVFDMNNKYLNAMVKVDRVVIDQISVNYGADGFMQQTSDGVPKFISLAIQFKEVDMTTSDDYDKIPAV